MKLWTNRILFALWAVGAVTGVILMWIVRLRLDRIIAQSI